jgi:hypothetical protein
MIVQSLLHRHPERQSAASNHRTSLDNRPDSP